MLIRLVLVFPFAYVPRFLSARIRARDPYPPWRIPFVLGWAGMRGAVSLAAALAIPLDDRRGCAVPRARADHLPDVLRDPLHARRAGAHAAAGSSSALGLEDDGLEAEEDARARKRAAMAALERLDELELEDVGPRGHRRAVARPLPLPERPLRRAARRRRRKRSRSARRRTSGCGASCSRAEEQAVVQLRREGEISDDVMNRVLRDIALEDARLDS